MLKKRLNTWGDYLLALLCAAVIIFSAVWAKKPDTPGTPALSDESQRLADGTAAQVSPIRPVPGLVLQPFSAEPVYFPESSLWLPHSAVDFAAADGETVRAAFSGTVTWNDGVLTLDAGGGTRVLYRGLKEASVRSGQTVRAGDAVGISGAAVPWEGGRRVCVTLEKNGQPVSFTEMLDKPRNQSYNKIVQSIFLLI